MTRSYSEAAAVAPEDYAWNYVHTLIRLQRVCVCGGKVCVVNICVCQPSVQGLNLLFLFPYHVVCVCLSCLSCALGVLFSVSHCVYCASLWIVILCLAVSLFRCPQRLARTLCSNLAETKNSFKTSSICFHWHFGDSTFSHSSSSGRKKRKTSGRNEGKLTEL